MQRKIFAVTAMCATTVFGIPLAFADSPHFIEGSSGATLNADGSLTVSFKEAGLGTNQNIDYLASANATATYVCVNNGSAHPKASNKTAVSEPVSASGTFNSGQNGQITAALILGTELVPPAGFSCPSGQTMELAAVSYTEISVVDLTNSIVLDLPDLTPGCLLPDVRNAC